MGKRKDNRRFSSRPDDASAAGQGAEAYPNELRPPRRPASSASFRPPARCTRDLQKSAKDSTLEHSLFAAFNTLSEA